MVDEETTQAAAARDALMRRLLDECLKDLGELALDVGVKDVAVLGVNLVRLRDRELCVDDASAGDRQNFSQVILRPHSAELAGAGADRCCWLAFDHAVCGGRETQSTAFLIADGSPPLYSGVTKSSASDFQTSSRSFDDPRVVQIRCVEIFVVVGKVAQDLDIKLHQLRVNGDYP